MSDTVETWGIGNEPTETKYPNGNVIPENEQDDFDGQDAHFEVVDKLVDEGVANYAEARDMKGYDPDKYEAAAHAAEHDEHPGVAVELGERAAAVAQLMDGISEQNRAAGALSALQNSEAFNSRYADPGKVADRMAAKAAHYQHAEAEAIETLSKTAALRAIGFNEPELHDARDSIEHDLVPFRTAGAKAARNRKHEKTITERTAHTVHNKNNTQ